MDVFVGALAFVLGASLVSCAPSSTTPPAAAASPKPGPSTNAFAGRTAPDFSRPDLNGVRFTLSAAQGHVAVVKFIAKYCVPCQRTLPAIERLHRDHPEVTIVGVSEDESEDDARSLVALYQLTFPIVHDQGNVLAGRYRVTALPVTFVVDAAGAVSWVGGPATTEGELTSAILGR
jgi:peroxiredoxin